MACMAHGVCGAIVIEAVGEVHGYVLALALTPLRNSAVLTAHYSVLFKRLKYAIWWPVLVREPVLFAIYQEERTFSLILLQSWN